MTRKTDSDSLALVWLPVGLVLGIAFGLVLGNLAAGLLVGLAFGAALTVGFRADARRRRARGPRD